LICLNKNLLLTHGNPIGLSALFARLQPAGESFTAVLEISKSTSLLFGQVIHQSGNRSARMNFVLAENDQNVQDFPALLDYLCCKAGEMGAFSVLAEVEETLPLFESLRRTGFNVYGRETVWKFPRKLMGVSQDDGNWVVATPADDSNIRTLHQLMVPPLIQSIEPFTNGETPRLVYKKAGEIVAYVESSSGPNGIYLKPVIHPSVENIAALLSELAGQFIGLDNSIYLQIRSYQAWLLATLPAVGGESSTHFALLVKHLAIAQRNGVTITQRARSERRQVEPTAPIVTNFEIEHPIKPSKQDKINTKGFYDTEKNYR
jgi:hypothetical protein